MSRIYNTEYKKGGWINKAVNPAHKGYCTPMSKSTCTPHRKAFAMTMKKHHGFHSNGGEVNKYTWGGVLSGGASGAAAGATFGPWGAAAGAVIGAGAGYFMSEKKKKEDEDRQTSIRNTMQNAQEQQVEQAKQSQLNTDRSMASQFKLNNSTALYKKGGRIYKQYKQYKGGGEIKKDTPIKLANENSYDTLIEARKELKEHGIDNPALYEDENSPNGYFSALLDEKGNATPFSQRFLINYNNAHPEFACDPNGKQLHPLRGVNPALSYNWKNIPADVIDTLQTKVIPIDYRNPNKYKKASLLNSPTGTPLGGGMIGIGSKKYANGGGIGNVNINSKNTRTVDDTTKLILNDNGSTSGYHETGDNIPMYENGSKIGNVEPGELVTKDPKGNEVVLSKRLGFADRYLQLTNMQKAIEKEKKILPYMNEQVANKLNIGKQKWGGGRTKYASGGNILDSFSNMSSSDLHTGIGVLGTLGTALATNETLNSQKGDIQNMMNLSSRQSPILNRYSNIPTNVDISDQTGTIQQGYRDTQNRVRSIADPSERSALLNNANMNRLTALGNVYSNRNRLQSDLIGRNVQGINQTQAMNTEIQNRDSAEKLQRNLQGLSALSSIKSQKISNMQGMLGELGGIRRDKLGMDALQASHKEIGTTFEGDNNSFLSSLYDKYKTSRALQEGEDITNRLGQSTKFDPSKITDNKFGGKLKTRKNRMYAR